mgnify:CR=1 FL=1
MALRLLLTNLEGGLNFYPNHNTPSTAGGFNYGGSTSVFDNKLFRQKSFNLAKEQHSTDLMGDLVMSLL